MNWEQPHSADNVLLYFTPFAWPRTGTAMASDGKLQFDLDHFDQAYFDRMRGRVMAAGERGIYVSIMLFDGWDLTNSYNDTSGFPMASGNNINGVATTPAEFLSLSNPAITALQEAYVRKVIDTVNELDNVPYGCSCRPDREARGRPIAHLELRASPRYRASRPQPATYPWSGAARPESTFPCAASPSRLPCLTTPISYLMITGTSTIRRRPR